MIIRYLEPKDATLFGESRRQALVDYPAAFAQNEAEWLALPKEEIASRLRNLYQPERRFVIGAFANDNLVGMIGFLQLGRQKMHHKGFIWGVYVQADYQGQGVGGQLLDEALRAIRQVVDLKLVQLSVGVDNVTAVALYKSRGFQIYGTEASALCVDGHFIDQYHMVLFL
jgi:ribosomal protein S18 acetylase RimI-like enzyme